MTLKGFTMRRASTLVAALAAIVPAAAFGTHAQAAVSHALIQGSGSSWSANAVNQWIADVQPQGLQVVFTASGSAQGRKDFANRTTDYAVSDIGFLGKDPKTGDDDTSQGRAYAYLPIVAGGTAFPYQIRVAGQLVRNLRLSGLTLAKIFTNKITNWNDPEITSDNNGRALPDIPIIPVVHSEGSGSTAQFTRYLDSEFASLWRPFNGASGLTEYFPRQDPQIAQNGSDGVMNFISSAAANGAIGYDEYSYALGKNYPVAKIENSAHYFTAPTQYNVAVALTQAQINMDKTSPNYLLQNLNNVYVYSDKRTYPLSSYSYAIIPTASNDPRMTTAKRQTLADWLFYSVCQGQAEMGPIGYSPLPVNLVQASFDQVTKLKSADAGVDLTAHNVTNCHNPTFDPKAPKRNYLAEIAPLPPACDQAGKGPCTGNQGLANGNPYGGAPTGGSGGSTSGGATSGTTGSVTNLGTTTGATTGGLHSTTAGLAGGTAGVTQETSGQPLLGGSNPDPSVLLGSPLELPESDGAGNGMLSLFAVALLGLVLFVPPLLARRWSHAGKGT